MAKQAKATKRDTLIARLRRSRDEADARDQHDYADGTELGRAWAERHATYAELRDLAAMHVVAARMRCAAATLTCAPTPPESTDRLRLRILFDLLGGDVRDARALAAFARRAFRRGASDSIRHGEMHGWMGGAHEVWLSVADDI